MTLIAASPAPQVKLRAKRAVLAPVYPYIELVSSLTHGQKAKIKGRNIAVSQIVGWVESGERVDHIAADYDLTLAEIYAALLYYQDHKIIIDKQIAIEAAIYDEALKQHSKLDEKIERMKNAGQMVNV